MWFEPSMLYKMLLGRVVRLVLLPVLFAAIGAFFHSIACAGPGECQVKCGSEYQKCLVDCAKYLGDENKQCRKDCERDQDKCRGRCGGGL